MASVSALGDYIGSVIHPAAKRDEIVAARHKGFISFHLCGGIAAFAALPLLLAARGGAPSAVEIAVLGWLIVPVLAALYLARTGDLPRAALIVSASLSALALFIAVTQGGTASFALAWLPVAVVEAMLSGSRRVTLAGLGIAACVVAVLLITGHHLPAPAPGALAEVSAVFCVLYMAGLLWRWEHVRTIAARSTRVREERSRLIADHAGELVTRHGESGAVVFASSASERLLGVQDRDLHGRGLFERVHIGDRPAYLTALSAARQGKETCVRIRVRGAGEGQDFRALEMRCRPEIGGRGDAIAVLRDIPEAGAAPAASAESASSDRAAQTKARFLGNMSHELRTPLNAIIGFSEILAQEDLAQIDPARRREYAELIHESGLHLLSVVNGMLDMSRIESGNFAILAEPFEVAPVVESCLQMFGLKAEKSSVRLRTEIAGDLPRLLADKRACKQILINLLSNAIKFTPAGGQVRINVHTDKQDVVIEVADTGVGISKEDLPHIGTSFFQARSSYDRPYDGTGLGLSVVKGLVALHTGTFRIESELGKGTRVVVRLPHDPGDHVPVKTSAPTFPAHRERRAAIG